jgi:hypothetical protein
MRHPGTSTGVGVVSFGAWPEVDDVTNVEDATLVVGRHHDETTIVVDIGGVAIEGDVAGKVDSDELAEREQPRSIDRRKRRRVGREPVEGRKNCREQLSRRAGTQLGELAPTQQDVVRPLEPDERPWLATSRPGGHTRPFHQAVDRLDDGHADSLHHLAGPRSGVSEVDRCEQVAAGGSIPASIESAAARRLMVGPEYGPVSQVTPLGRTNEVVVRTARLVDDRKVPFVLGANG